MAPWGRASFVVGVACAACGRFDFETCAEVPATCGEGASGGPIASGLVAPVLLFQPTYASAAANAGGAIQLGGVDGVYSVGGYFDPFDHQTKLFVNDRRNHRVLVYDHVPTQSQAVPDRVIGQVDFTSGLADAGQPSPNAGGLADNVDVSVCDSGEMFVADASNHRVLGWRRVPADNGRPADYVLGQPDFASNAPGTSATQFNRPYAAHCIEGRLFVPDLYNHRILVYDPAPTDGAARPRYAIGQPDLVTGTPGCGPTSLTNPYEVLHHDGRYYVADGGNHRVLVFDDGFALGQGTPIAVLGQPDLMSCQPNRGASAPDATTLSFPNGLAARGDMLVVSDHDNRRVLFYRLPVTTGAPAAALLGQPSFTTSTLLAPPDDTSLGRTKGLVLDGDFVWIGDETNNRVLAMRLPALP